MHFSFCALSDLSVLLSSSVHSFFLQMHLIVDLATPNVFAVSLISIFSLLLDMMTSLMSTDTPSDLIFETTMKSYKSVYLYRTSNI